MKIFGKAFSILFYCVHFDLVVKVFIQSSSYSKVHYKQDHYLMQFQYI